MKKKLSTIKILFICSLIILCAVTTAFAWFASNNKIGNDMSGSALTGYFYAGDGSSEKPYQIKDKIHVYNFAWLQYMGQLNYNEDKTIKQLYFELVDDIDMTGIVLPPIGTIANPFIGHFDGNGYCISNLTVSNYLQEGNVTEGIVNRPLSVTNIDGSSVSIVGFFGVVGDPKGTLTGLADDSKTNDVTQKVNAVHDLFLDNLTVRTETDQSLIGLFAGYVNGSASNIGVGNSSIVIGDSVYPLTKTVAFDMDKVMSTYSLVGKYNSDNVEWKDGIGWSDNSSAPSGGSGWGDSINIAQLRKRITYIAGAVGLQGSYYLITNKFGYNGFIRGGSQRDIIDGSSVISNTYPAFISGSIMPLSLDTDKIDFSEINENSTSPLKDKLAKDKSGNILPSIEYYLTNKTNLEPVASMNTGYIVGGGSRNLSYTGHYIEIRNDYVAGGFSSGKSSSLGIAKSIYTKIDKTIKFPTNNLHLLTNVPTDDASPKTYVISDDYNGSSETWLSQQKNYEFVRFDDARLGFKNYQIGTVGNDKGVRNKFVESSKGSSVIQGILFNSKIQYDPNNPTDLSKLEVVAAKNVTILGTTYYGADYTGSTDNTASKTNYSMLEGAINFSLLSAGRVTTIAATYSTYQTDINTPSSSVHTLFRIFKLTRNSSNEITACEIINTVYEVINPATGEAPYAYNLVDPDPAKYKLVFDYNSMGTLKEAGAAYYFEIPLNAGDYAIGSITADSSKKGAYLLYLDIGASGDMSVGPGPSNGKVHLMTDVKFVESSYIQSTKERPADRTTAAYKAIAFKIELNNKTTNSTGLQISFTPGATDVIHSATALPPSTSPAGDFVITKKKNE